MKPPPAFCRLEKSTYSKYSAKQSTILDTSFSEGAYKYFIFAFSREKYPAYTNYSIDKINIPEQSDKKQASTFSKDLKFAYIA